MNSCYDPNRQYKQAQQRPGQARTGSGDLGRPQGRKAEGPARPPCVPQPLSNRGRAEAWGDGPPVTPHSRTVSAWVSQKQQAFASCGWKSGPGGATPSLPHVEEGAGSARRSLHEDTMPPAGVASSRGPTRHRRSRGRIQPTHSGTRAGAGGLMEADRPALTRHAVSITHRWHP